MAPVPLTAIVWGEPAELSTTLTVAVKLAGEGGVKVTERVQLAPLDNFAPQVFFKPKTEGLAPVNVILEIFSVAVPEFDKVTVRTALVVPGAVSENDRVAGVRTVWGVFFAAAMARLQPAFRRKAKLTNTFKYLGISLRICLIGFIFVTRDYMVLSTGFSLHELNTL